ncbi:MAG: hypothetical protein IT304_02810 [Dehalococcoidia bacterium]|nr:hypothetical protein [Dehalococcoidia bacterium]
MASKRPDKELLLEPPIVRHAELTPAPEDRVYLLFVAGAFIAALGGGFVLGLLTALGETGLDGLDGDVPWLIQAHGWAQLQGWAGLFVAGMGLRLLPRFAGRRPLPGLLTAGVFVLLAGGMALRVAGQATGPGRASEALLLAGCVAAAAGAAAFATTVGAVLGRARHRHDPWFAFAAAGACWWVVWAGLLLAAGVRGAANDAFVPVHLDDTSTWIVALGAVGNFIWAVQSRAVPIFFGRKTPPLRRAALPGTLLQLGLLALLVSLWTDDPATRERLVGAGFVLAGAAIAVLAPLAGSIWGEADRLRPRARSAARFVIAGNLAALAAGLFLVWAGVLSLISGDYEAFGLRDAARHAFGLGTITLLIAGMAQLVAPFFALRRVEAGGPALADRVAWWGLLLALVARVLSGLLSGIAGLDARMHLAAAAGVLAWAGLAAFAGMAAHALSQERRRKALIAGNAEAARARR